MAVWAIADLHLAFGVPSKTMEVFGPEWADYANKIEKNWRELISPDDLVLIPGDISWAMRLEDAAVDLGWIDALPGTKVIIRGNHDYWWGSSSKMSKIMPPSIHFIQNDVFNWNEFTIGGTRLWDTEEYGFGQFIDFQEHPNVKEKVFDLDEQQRIFDRELERLKLSLKQLDPKANIRIALTHYPPIGADLKPSRASAILEEFKIDVCIFGHLHRLKKDAKMFGEARGIRYLLTSCDYLDFIPVLVYP
jgi:predicted phosphohydrolase